MEKEVSPTGGAIGLCGATFIAFLCLKLFGKITWSWLWVTVPIWIPLFFWLGGLIAIGWDYIFKKSRTASRKE
jgi:hypothetical protein